jgi:hypothetical protein
MNDELPNDLISATKAAKLCDVHIATIYRWAFAGRVRSWKRTNRLYLSRAELQGLFVRQQAKVSPEQRARLEMQEESNRNGLASDHLFRLVGRRLPGPPAA